MSESAEVTPIKEILERPEEFAGKTVIIEAEHIGWGAAECDLTKTAIRTRSDVLLRQEGFCIFSDMIPGVSPTERVKVKVRATVQLIMGRPRLQNPELLEKG